MPPDGTLRPAINFRHRRYVAWLAGAFLLLTILLGIAPRHRQDWILENVLVLAALGVLWAIYRKMPFSRLSWTLVFVFLGIHEVGAHYTYSEVPYDAWFQAVTGRTFNSLVGWERNNFDRIIHLLYGLMLAYPIREIFLHLAKVRGFWSYFLPLDLTLSSSAFYEMRMGRGGGLWRRTRRRLCGHAGRSLGCSEGHGAGGCGCIPRDVGHRHRELALSARFRPRMDGQPAYSTTRRP
jgi:uncharacterized membrane protein YjdF